MNSQFFDDRLGVVPPSRIDVDAMIDDERRIRRRRRIGGVAVATATVAAGVTALTLTGAGATNARVASGSPVSSPTRGVAKPSATVLPSDTPVDAAFTVVLNNSVGAFGADLANDLPDATITLTKVTRSVVKLGGYPRPVTFYQVGATVRTTAGTSHVELLMSRPPVDSIRANPGTYGGSTLHKDGTEVSLKQIPGRDGGPTLTPAQIGQIVADPALTLAP